MGEVLHPLSGSSRPARVRRRGRREDGRIARGVKSRGLSKGAGEISRPSCFCGEGRQTFRGRRPLWRAAFVGAERDGGVPRGPGGPPRLASWCIVRWKLQTVSDLRYDSPNIMRITLRSAQVVGVAFLTIAFASAQTRPTSRPSDSKSIRGAAAGLLGWRLAVAADAARADALGMGVIEGSSAVFDYKAPPDE